MASIDLTVPLPILVAPQFFRVRHRILGASIWTDDAPIEVADQLLNPNLTITGLTSRETYEVSITLIKSASPLIACDEIIEEINIVATSGCNSYGVSIIGNESDSLYYLSISATGSHPDPCGGTDFIYWLSGQPHTTVHFPGNIPTSTLILATNDSYNWEARALDCQGNYTLCDSGVTDPIDIPCTPATLVKAEIKFIGGLWWVYLTITQSAPITNPFSISYLQANIFSAPPYPSPTLPNDQGGSFLSPATSTTTVISWQVQPTFGYNPTLSNNISLDILTYIGTIVDRCRNSIKWQASVILT